MMEIAVGEHQLAAIFGEERLDGIGKQIQEPCYGSGVRPLQGVAFPKHRATRKQSDTSPLPAPLGEIQESWRRANWFILPNDISLREIRSFPALNRSFRSPPKLRQWHSAPQSDLQNR